VFLSKQVHQKYGKRGEEHPHSSDLSLWVSLNSFSVSQKDIMQKQIVTCVVWHTWKYSKVLAPIHDPSTLSAYLQKFIHSAFWKYSYKWKPLKIPVSKPYGRHNQNYKKPFLCLYLCGHWIPIISQETK
jgi:hypothetical protein